MDNIETREDIVELPESNLVSVNIDVGGSKPLPEPAVKTAMEKTVDMSQLVPQTSTLD